MRRILLAGLLAAAGLLWTGFVIAAASGAPIEDPLRVDFPPNSGLTDALVGERIKLIAAARNWRIESEQPRRIGLATVVNNKHMVRIEFAYSGSGYTLRYVESNNMRYRPDLRTIHPNYNLWARDFCKALNTALGVNAMASVPLAYPAGAPASAAAPAAAVAGAAVPMAVAVAAAPTAVAVPAAPSQPAANGLPALGSKWKYGYRDRQYDYREQYFTVEVAGVEQTRVRDRLAADGGQVQERIIDPDKLAFVTRQLGRSQSVVELTPYLRDLQNRSSEPPEGYPAPAGVQWKVSAPEYVEEEVRVSAGNFKALRIEVRGSSQAFGSMITGTARFVYTAWYSRELNRYVKIQHQTWNRQNGRIGDEQVQLVAYQLGK